MRELALFAGAGGGILGGKLLGWRTVCAVENDRYAASVLIQRQNDGSLQPFPIWDDVRTFDGKPWGGLVDVVSGGFPCTDISLAGKGAGIEGEQSGLWGEMARVIREVEPRFVFVENSPALTSRGLGVVLGDLASMGFDAECGVLGAHHVGAPHKRDRIWIVARHPHRSRHRRLRGGLKEHRTEQGARGHIVDRLGERGRGPGEALADASSRRRGKPEAWKVQLSRGAEAIGPSNVAHPDRNIIRDESGRLSGSCGEGAAILADHGEAECVADANGFGGRCGACQQDGAETCDRGWWESEPDVGRVAYGISSKMDRLRAIGNGQVPAVAALAWRILSERLTEKNR